MRFAPRIDFIALLVQILSKFEKSHFSTFSFVGFRILQAGRIFYESKIGQKSAGIPSTTPTLCPEKMEQITTKF